MVAGTFQYFRRSQVCGKAMPNEAPAGPVANTFGGIMRQNTAEVSMQAGSARGALCGVWNRTVPMFHMFNLGKLMKRQWLNWIVANIPLNPRQGHDADGWASLVSGGSPVAYIPGSIIPEKADAEDMSAMATYAEVEEWSKHNVRVANTAVEVGTARGQVAGGEKFKIGFKPDGEGSKLAKTMCCLSAIVAGLRSNVATVVNRLCRLEMQRVSVHDGNVQAGAATAATRGIDEQGCPLAEVMRQVCSNTTCVYKYKFGVAPRRTETRKGIVTVATGSSEDGRNALG